MTRFTSVISNSSYNTHIHILKLHRVKTGCPGGDCPSLEEHDTLKHVRQDKSFRRCSVPLLTWCLLTHEISEASDGQATGTSDKLQQPHPLLVVHLLDELSGNIKYMKRSLNPNKSQIQHRGLEQTRGSVPLMFVGLGFILIQILSVFVYSITAQQILC